MKKYLLLLIIIVLTFIALYVGRETIALEAVRIGNTFFTADENYNLGRADFFYRVALILHGDAEDAWHQRARIYFLQGDFDGALEKIEKQIALHGTDLMASYYIRGLVHGYRKEFVEARRDFRTFLLWDPNNWAARNDLAWTFFATGDFAAAGEEAGRGLAADPGNPWLRMMRGMARHNLGEREGARADLAAARAEALRLTEEDWRRAYPGNDPKAAGAGLRAMRKAVDENLSLVNKLSVQEEDKVYWSNEL